MDLDVEKELKRALKKDKMKIILNARCKQGTIKNGKASVLYEHQNKENELVTDVCLIATGRRPFTANLGLETMGILTDKQGRVIVNQNFMTNKEGIYAIGDVIEGPMLAHKAEDEGYCLAEYLSGKDFSLNYNAIPGIVYTHPEAASVGSTEQELKEKGVKYKKGSFSLLANSRFRTSFDSSGGFCKILVDENDRILGGHIVGPHAGEMIHELILGLQYGASSQDIAHTVHGHPTLSEIVRQSALSVQGNPTQS